MNQFQKKKFLGVQHWNDSFFPCEVLKFVKESRRDKQSQMVVPIWKKEIVRLDPLHTFVLFSKVKFTSHLETHLQLSLTRQTKFIPCEMYMLDANDATLIYS